MIRISRRIWFHFWAASQQENWRSHRTVQWVVYTTFPDFNLWRSKRDGSERLQLTFAPINAHEPRWSPDGKQILFTDVPRRRFRVLAEGGHPQQVMPKGEFPDGEVGAGFWLSNRNWIAFVMGSDQSGPYAIYRMNLETQERFKVPGSDGDVGFSRLKRWPVHNRTQYN